MARDLSNIIDKVSTNMTCEKSIVDEVVAYIKTLDKSLTISDFKLDRIEKERKTVSILLEETIDELQKKNVAIENTNVALNKTLGDLRETQQQLVMSEKMASLGQLTAGVAHEINNPINFVSANIKPLKDDLQDLLKCIRMYDKTISEKDLEMHFGELRAFQKRLDMELLIAEVDDLLKGIEVGAARTTEIVKGLRNFSRLDQNDLKKADINEGLDSTLLLLHSTYKDRITIVKQLGDIPQIDCFPGQLNQVFMNVLSNAIQAIEGEGSITLTTYEDANNIKISIKDTGNGMTDEVKNKLFDPFFTTKDVGQGTGLGLSISYGIIEKHKGKIEVNSELGQGSEFIISLPIISAQT